MLEIIGNSIHTNTVLRKIEWKGLRDENDFQYPDYSIGLHSS
jgi:hypothetical protein